MIALGKIVRAMYTNIYIAMTVNIPLVFTGKFKWNNMVSYERVLYIFMHVYRAFLGTNKTDISPLLRFSPQSFAQYEFFLELSTSDP